MINANVGKHVFLTNLLELIGVIGGSLDFSDTPGLDSSEARRRQLSRNRSFVKMYRRGLVL